MQKPKFAATLPAYCPNPPCFTVIFMDAGQGDATLVVFPDNSLMLIDCGSKKNAAIVQDEIEKVLDAYLKQTKNQLQALVLTHPDGDHYNLINELIINKNVQIGTVLWGGNVQDYADIGGWLKKHPNVYPLLKNSSSLGKDYYETNVIPQLSFDGTGKYPNVETRILLANAGDPNIKKDANPNSIVLLLTYADVNIFLMGDSTTDTEAIILSRKKPKEALNTLLTGRHTVLKAGHHGSYTSSGSVWISKIKPEVAFISSDMKTFSGVSIPRKEVIDTIINFGNIVNLPGFTHSYVQYTGDSKTGKHELSNPTDLAIYTTLHYLVPDTTFPGGLKADGTSWYYTISGQGRQIGVDLDVWITPACGWDKILQSTH